MITGNLGSLDEDELPGGLEAGVAAIQEGIRYRKVRCCVCWHTMHCMGEDTIARVIIVRGYTDV